MKNNVFIAKNIYKHILKVFAPAYARETTPKISQEMDKRIIENLTRHADVSEKAIERYLVERCREHGLPCLKYSNPNCVGYPDRLIVLPGGMVLWVELKSKGRKPSKIQLARMDELTDLGHSAVVIDNKAAVDELINAIAL